MSSDNRDMDPKLVIGFIFSHYVLIFGTTLALFFTVSMVLLIRSIGQKNGEVLPIDVDAIEDVMKRVLSTQPISITSAAPKVFVAPSSEDSQVDTVGDESGASSEVLAERDATIESLKQEIDALKAESSGKGDGGGTDSSPYVSEIADLNIKVDELQARLAEYEIIEDDIADLSMFKEKNRSVETEVTELKTKLTEAASLAATQAAAAQKAPAPEPAASLTPSLDSGIKFEKIDKFELDMNDEAMKAFTEAVEGNSAAIAAVKNLPPSADTTPVAAPVAVAATADVSVADLGSQADIDALFKAHTGAGDAPSKAEPEAPPSPSVGAQSDIDALMKAHSASPETQAETQAETSEVKAEPEAPPPSVDSQADIDALMKAHSSPALVAPVPVPVPVAEVAPAPVFVPEPVAIKPMAHEPGLDDLLMGGALLSPEEMAAQDSTQMPAEERSPHSQTEEVEDPLAGVTDAEKMLSEVETIAHSSGNSDEDALEEALDTDKLLAEVDSLKAGMKSA